MTNKLMSTREVAERTGKSIRTIQLKANVLIKAGFAQWVGKTLVCFPGAVEYINKSGGGAAELVSPSYENQYPGYIKVHDCINTVREYMNDEATEQDLKRIDDAYAATWERAEELFMEHFGEITRTD